MAEWMAKAAVLRMRRGPERGRMVPVWETNKRSEGWMREKCRPKGFTQKQSGWIGSCMRVCKFRIGNTEYTCMCVRERKEQTYPNCDMPSNTLIIPQTPKDPKSLSKAELEIRALLLLALKRRRARHSAARLLSHRYQIVAVVLVLVRVLVLGGGIRRL